MSDDTNTKRLDEELAAASERIAELEARLESSESESFYEFAFRNAPGGMGVVSLEGNILSVNKTMALILGYSGSELLTMKTVDLYAEPGTRERLLDKLQRCNTVHDEEIPMRCKDGSIIWLSVSLRPTSFKGQDAVLVAALDITGHRNTEAVLAESEQRMNTILDSMQAGLVIIDPDTHVIVDINKYGAEMVGRPREEIVGNICHSFLCPQAKGQCPVTDLGQDVDSRECIMLSRKGRQNVLKTVSKLHWDERDFLLESFIDIGNLTEAREALRLDQSRFEVLYELSAMADRPEQEILDFVLEAIVKVTESEIGYIYYLSDDEEELTLHAWSKNVMSECRVESIPEVYKVEHTGLWGEAVRRREPVITNDYENSPLKRGVPAGHVPVRRHMNMPLMDRGRIVLLAGVGNKEEEYGEEDIMQMTLVLDGMWRILRRKRADEELRTAHAELEGRVEERTADLARVNKDLSGLNMQLMDLIREKTKAEENLRESEERFRAIFENNHAVMLLVNPESGLIEDANPAAARYYGYARKKLLAMNISDINTLAPETVRKEMARAKMQKRRYFLFKHRLKSGEIRDVEVFSGPIRVGGKTFLYSIVHDVTDRKRMETELLRYERIVSTTSDLISMVDRNYIYRTVNDAYLHAFDLWREDIVGKTVEDLIGKELFERVTKPSFAKAFAGEIVRAESWVELPASGRRFFIMTYSPVEDRDGEIQYVSINARDITERKKAEEELRSYSDRLTLATVAGGIGIWEWNVETGELDWDDRMFELYDVRPDEFSGVYEAWRNRVHPEDLADAEGQLQETLEGKGMYDAEFRIVLPSRQIRYVKAAALTLVNLEGEVIRMVGINQDITERRQMEEAIRKLALIDPLTGARNRRDFMERSERELERCERYGHPLAFFLLDIDHFKSINDTYGHAAGDEVLKHMVDRSETALRATDVFCRIGGEEFAVILPETREEDALHTAERLRKSLESMVVETGDKAIRFTVSIGVTRLRPTDDSLDSIMKRADKALYRAKQTGRNKVVTA